MIDIYREEVAPLTQAANRWIPSRPHISTVWRWVSRGIRGHRLEVVKIGGVAHTSRESVTRFLSAINDGGPVTTNSDERERQIAAAEARLAAAGVR